MRFWSRSHYLKPLTADHLLPPHLVVEVVELLEEVVHLAALVVSFGGGEHAVLGFLGEVLTDVWHRKHNLLHAAIVTHNLKSDTVYFKKFHIIRNLAE